MEYIKETHGSVKTLGVIKQPTRSEVGEGDFIFRQDYSVFDWGIMPMPDGKTLDNRPVALVGAYNHELLESHRLLVCYKGCVDEQGKEVPLARFKERKSIPTKIRVLLANVVKPVYNPKERIWDYDRFATLHTELSNYMLPLEFIWRAEAGEESSFWKNIQAGKYELSDFGLPEELKPGDAFPQPILDHSSKFEPHDRYFSPEKARVFAGLERIFWTRLTHLRTKANKILTEHANNAGFERPDGKQEYFVMIKGGAPMFFLADVAGTWHEDRFTYTAADGMKVKVSKQPLRNLNKLLNREWYEHCEKAKKKAEEGKTENWRDLVTVRPKPLEPQFFETYNALMQAAANQYVGWNAFPEAPPLEKAARDFQKHSQDYEKRLKA